MENNKLDGKKQFFQLKLIDNNKDSLSYQIDISNENELFQIPQNTNHYGESQKSENKIYDDYSFENFIKNYQDAKLNSSASWNKARENYQREQRDKRRVIIKEINQFDFKVYLFV